MQRPRHARCQWRSKIPHPSNGYSITSIKLEINNIIPSIKSEINHTITNIKSEINHTITNIKSEINHTTIWTKNILPGSSMNTTPISRV